MSLTTRLDTVRALPTESLLRNGLTALAVLSSAATATELILLQHWGSPLELIPWFALALLGLAIALVVRSTRGTVLAARVLGIGVLALAAIGVGVHVWTNYRAGPLDAEYMYAWSTLSELARWFLAATASVGPSPALAPMALAFSSLCLLLATVRHPALEVVSEPSGFLAQVEGGGPAGSLPEASRTRAR